MGRARILIVEDEPAIRQGVCDLLAFHGHHPEGVGDGDEGLRMALTREWELVLLDVMLPGMDGFDICRRLRTQHPGLAVLMLTAKGREADVLEGFRAGCDDYVTKPFSMAQLVARVDALLRRAASVRPRRVPLGPLELDADHLMVRYGSAEIALSPRDVEVLAYLSENRHRVVTREDLLREVWGYQRTDHVETRCVDMHLVKLRRKLAELAPQLAVIETVRGAGYRLERGLIP
jgi:two-component system alkaline phosphatase synthesis response regulator PhoP